MGHHLPGMIRAYGDRALFSRFKTRFIVAPVALVIVCIWSSVYNIMAVQLVAMAWGIWHGMMQTYGFGRIYDAKALAREPARARVDLALCFAWFSAAVLLSPMRFRTLLQLYYESGGPVIASSVVEAIRLGIVVALALVTIVFLWRQWSDWRAGRGFSPVKLTLLVTSIAFWWYCNNGVQNILVGIALFEVFHDVQYLAIVWIYNRARVERDSSIRGFMRFVFRRSGALIGVYVGLVLAYGALGFTQSAITMESMRHGLIGIITASALLHFYYDGFIWKVREPQTGNMLGIQGTGPTSLRSPRQWPAWARHSLRWAALVIPFGALCAAQLVGRVVPAIERTAKVAEVLPQDPKAQLNYGKALHEMGRVEEALRKYEFAISRDPSLAEAEFYLGLAWKDLGDLDRAQEHYERSFVLDPKNGKCESNLAGVLLAKGLRAEARRHYEHSITLNPLLQIAHKELGDILRGDGEYQAAIAQYEAALRIQPDFAEAKNNLAFTRSLLGQ
jgi:Flp pilus assembly protein TadD